MTPQPLLQDPIKLTVLGLVGLLGLVTILAGLQRRALFAELDQETVVLHRLASQRADQHDAHLTALSAIAAASDDPEQRLFLEVSETIVRFYPRIDDIELVPLASDATIVGTRPASERLILAVREAAAGRSREVVLLAHPDRSGHYIMVKRSPNTDAARYGLMLGVDAAALLEDAGPFWDQAGIGLSLSLPDGTVLFGRQPRAAGGLHVNAELGSVSQPLRLETIRLVNWTDLFPPLRSGVVFLMSSVLWFGGIGALRQRARARQALEQARLSALDSRLAHASRVNALGEMASGLTHELTQPLTAILAQVQAGRRLLARGDTAALAPVLEDTVTQARRASAILERFRNWSRPHVAPAAAFDFRDALRNVEALLAPQAAAQGLKLEFDVPPTSIALRADPIEMEQVVFNLLRNAIEATQAMGSAAKVQVTLRNDAGRALLEIADNGPGVPPDLRARLFTPFTTTRPDGTGLGLALSQRLVERAGGEIMLADSPEGARFRVMLPLNRGSE